MPFSCARAAARCGPSVRARELCLRSTPDALIGWTLATASGRHGRERAGGAQRSVSRARRRSTPRTLEALALPAAEAPDVPVDRLGVDLAPGEVHVGLGDQAPLVSLERHPLRQ